MSNWIFKHILKHNIIIYVFSIKTIKIFNHFCITTHTPEWIVSFMLLMYLYVFKKYVLRTFYAKRTFFTICQIIYFFIIKQTYVCKLYTCMIVYNVQIVYMYFKKHVLQNACIFDIINTCTFVFMYTMSIKIRILKYYNVCWQFQNDVF